MIGKRNRMARPNEPSKHQAKLTPAAVEQIRSAGYYKTARQLAAEFGVHYRTIEKVRSGETWADSSYFWLTSSVAIKNQIGSV